MGQEGRYVALYKIGKGASSDVWEGRDTIGGQAVAIKVPIAARANDITTRAMFAHEVEVLVRLSKSDGGLRLYDFGADFIVTELVNGTSLRARLYENAKHDRSFELSDTFDIGRQLCSALHTLHLDGVVHRDIKPENIILTAVAGGHRATLVDYGIALLDGRHPTLATCPAGTLEYMAPEQSEAPSEVGPPADVFSVGVLLDEMICNRVPTQARVREPDIGLLTRAGCTLEQARFVISLLGVDPRSRPSCGQATRHFKAWSLSPADQRLQLTEDSVPKSTDFGVPGDSAGRKSEQRSRVSILLTIGRWTLLVSATAALFWTATQYAIWRTKESGLKVDSCSGIAGSSQSCVGPMEFTMGSDEVEIDEQCRWIGTDCTHEVLGKLRRQLHSHRVRVSAFAMDKTEVTCRSFADHLNRHRLRTQILGENVARIDAAGNALPIVKRYVSVDGIPTYDLGSEASCIRWDPVAQDFTVSADHARHPVELVTQLAAQFYCREHGESLPTEAQQEAVMRGAENRRYPSGQRLPTCEEVAFDQGDAADGRQSLCGKLPRSAWGPRDVGTSIVDEVPGLGLRDLDGNVAEWSADGWRDSYAGCAKSGCLDPVVPSTEGGWVAFRGGNHTASAVTMLSTYRSHAKATEMREGLGFRCVKNMPPQEN